MANSIDNPHRPSRVLILHDYGGTRGGAEQVALAMRRLLTARGLESRLFTSDADPWDEAAAPDHWACGVGTGMLRSVGEAWNRKTAHRLQRVLREFRPDVVQIIMFLTQLSPSILVSLKDVPTVYTANTYRAVCPTGLRWRPSAGLCSLPQGMSCAGTECISPWGLAPRLAQLAILRHLRQAIDRTVVPSAHMGQIFSRHGWPTTDVIPQAVPSFQRRRPMAEKPIIAFSGRLVAEKGVDWLLRSARVLHERGSSVQFHIHGEGPERERLEALTGTLGIEERVTFLGFTERGESQERLEAAWVQVVPSLWAEPFGLVAAEALARGTPVIASDVGGPPEIVDHGKTGWVAKAGCKESLAQTMLDACSDRQRLVRMGEKAKAVARERYDEGQWIDSYLDLYEGLLRGSA